jgi:hypothetical protein
VTTDHNAMPWPLCALKRHVRPCETCGDLMAIPGRTMPTWAPRALRRAGFHLNPAASASQCWRCARIVQAKRKRKHHPVSRALRGLRVAA